MGHGRIKAKNKMKKAYLGQAVQYIERLEKENQALKGDPNTIIGQFIGQFKELHAQNSRLSVLSACLIKKLGDQVKLTKEEMEAFKGNRINIKWELPDGTDPVNPEQASEYIFSFDLVPENAPPQTIGTPTPEVIPDCTDPDCTLPRSLKHVHTAPPVVGDVVPLPIAPNSDEPQAQGSVTIVRDVPVAKLEPGDEIVLNGEPVTVTATE